MNKKLTTIAGTIALGGVMLGATAYAAVAGTSGYDVYKQALKNTITVQSLTPKTQVTVNDNGSQIIKVDATTKVNKTNETMSNSMTVAAGGVQKTVDTYRQNGETVTKTSDSNVYNVMGSGREGKKHKNELAKVDDPSRIQDIENVADALVGNIQNYITMKNADDGSQEVSLEMSDNQVSPVVNAVASLAIKNAVNREEHSEFAGKADDALVANLKDKLPKLVNNIKVSKVDVDAKISNNLIQNQTESIVITGNDASGKAHEITVSIDTAFSGYNTTTPDKVNLTGKQVKQMTRKRFGHGGFEGR